MGRGFGPPQALALICVFGFLFVLLLKPQSPQSAAEDPRQYSTADEKTLREIVMNILKSTNLTSLIEKGKSDADRVGDNLKADAINDLISLTKNEISSSSKETDQTDMKSKTSQEASFDLRNVSIEKKNEADDSVGDGFFDPKDVSPDLELKFIATPIPKELVDYVRNLKSPHHRPDCSAQKPKHNFVYIKTHKTASDTLSALFRRFAYDRNLSVLLPIGRKFSIGWPHDLKKEYHRPSKTGEFNILVDHSKYTDKYMHKTMPEDSVYITSWRETFSHLKSAMAYMMIRQWSGIEEGPADGMEVFLHDLKGYDDIYKNLPPVNKFRPAHSCVPGDISMARNSMAADLGFPVGFPKGVYPDRSDNFTAIKEWLDHTNQVFGVVLLSDYFHHSLIMLKRMMCWSIKDILYERLNSWNTKYHPEYRKDLVDNFRRWSSADYLAFELFNNTLWDRINQWGHDEFMAELKQFEKTLETTKTYCLAVRQRRTSKEYIEIDATAFDDSFQIHKNDCILMKDHMRDTIKEQYDRIPGIVAKQSPNAVPGC